MLHTDDDLSRTSALMEALENDDARVRKLAAETIALFRPAGEALPRVLRDVADNDADPLVRQAAAEALVKLK